jgi:ABC-type transport system involved in multi-copper enzyme maturation permease subunit
MIVALPHQSAVLALGRATFKEAIRSKLLLSGLAFAGLLFLLLSAASSLAVFERQHLVQSVGLSAMGLLGTLVSIGTACGLYGQTIHNGQANACWVRPLPRGAYVVGRFLGLLAATSTLLLCMAGATAMAVIEADGAVGSGFAVATLASLLQAGMVLGLSMLLCSLLRPVTAGVLCNALLVVSLISGQLLELARRKPGTLTQLLLEAAYVMLPDLDRLNVVGGVLNAQPLPEQWWWRGPPYALLYMGCCLGACALLMRRRRLS